MIGNVLITVSLLTLAILETVTFLRGLGMISKPFKINLVNSLLMFLFSVTCIVVASLFPINTTYAWTIIIIYIIYYIILNIFYTFKKRKDDNK